MGNGILQLALSGKVPLQLEYREVEAQLRDWEDGKETADTDKAGRHPSPGHM
jgi:hypothetical protein